MSGMSMSGSGAMGFGVAVGGYQPGVYVPLKAFFLVCVTFHCLIILLMLGALIGNKETSILANGQ